MLGCLSAALDDDACARAWAASGVMHLTGPASGPPSVSPAGVVRPLIGLGEALASATRRLGAEVRVDAVGLAAQRAAFTGFGRNGAHSAGGFAHMVRASDGWVVLNLPRPSDAEALPALVGAAVPAGDWSEIQGRIAAMTAVEVVDQGSELGLAVAAVGATRAPLRPWSLRSEGPARCRSGRVPTVLDLSSLWAGPLAGGLLAEAGCRVLKVESAARSDGARRGPAGFFELLNGRKEQVSLDLPDAGAVGQLRKLIAGADLVIEASRPRVMHQWGISPEECVAAGTAWVSITGHGRSGQHSNRVAFGDDAAASGGLVVPVDPPMFVGDAIADPIAGLAAASVSAHLLAEGRAALAEVSLASASAWVAHHAGAAIQRPVVRSGEDWAVELADRLVAVHPPIHEGRLPSRAVGTVGVMSDARGWDGTLEDFERRRERARAMGGNEKLAARRAEGRLDARGRIDGLLDAGSFSEVGTLAGPVPADALVAGVGAIDGRPVAVGAEDFTTMGGSIGPAATRKRWRIADIAGRERIPLVMLLEGAGHRPPMPGDPGGGGPNDLQAQAALSGTVPMVCGVMGPSAGHGAITALLCDFSIMTPDAAIFTAGPPVVEASLGERVGKDDLGGPAVALGAGTIHNAAVDDADLLSQIRAYLSYFGSSAWEQPPVVDTGDSGRRRVDHMLDLVPRDGRRGYDMAAVVESLIDCGQSLPIQPGYGRSIICALARIGGEAVGIVANQPAVRAGSIDAAAADKAAHFISVCDAFHLPLLFLADNPGVLAGTASERAGVLRASARMYAAQTRATTVKIHVTLRKAFGFGSCVMAMNPHDSQTLSFAFPGATVGAMGAAGAGRAVGADEEAERDLHRAEEESAYRSASGLSFDEVIDPRDTRNAILAALQVSARRRSHPVGPKSRPGIPP